MNRLIVNYKSSNDKNEYRMPVLCTAKDIGKIIYEKWIIGGGYSVLNPNEKIDEDKEQFYIAYKLVSGSFIQCNFEIDLAQSNFLEFVGFDDWVEKKGDRGYRVDSFIDNYCPKEPNYDYHTSGLRYITMPSQK